MLEVNRGKAVSISERFDPAATHALMADIIMGLGIRPEYEIWI